MSESVGDTPGNADSEQLSTATHNLFISPAIVSQTLNTTTQTKQDPS